MDAPPREAACRLVGGKAQCCAKQHSKVSESAKQVGGALNKCNYVNRAPVPKSSRKSDWRGEKWACEKVNIGAGEIFLRNIGQETIQNTLQS